MINLSTKGRYATRIIVNLATIPYGDSKSARLIAAEEGITMGYVEQLLIKLKAAGFVKSRRGKNGGSILNRDADSITVAELLDAIEGKTAIAPCVLEPCERQDVCSTHLIWKEANDALIRVFESATIADLAKDKGQSVLNFQI